MVNVVSVPLLVGATGVSAVVLLKVPLQVVTVGIESKGIYNKCKH